MSFAKNIITGVRNHWKKSVFATVALTYGANYAKEYVEIQQLMTEYCEKAAVYGRQPIAPNENPRTVTIILNPNANKRKAQKNFEKYCAPILFLAGICVDLVQTESEGHAKTLVEDLGRTDAVVIAGGDGTLSEVITGLFRKAEANSLDIPIGVLPLGVSNKIGKYLFPGGDHLQFVRSLAEASLAIIEEQTKSIDVMKIEVIEDDEAKGKPVYAVSGIEWGAYRDAQASKDKYWYFGPLRRYVTYVFNGYKDNLCWNCEADIKYTLPCAGCANCIKARKQSYTRWYHRFLPYQQGKQENIPLMINERCLEIHEKKITTLDVGLLTTNTVSNISDCPSLKLHLGPNPSSVDYIDFIKQGWQTETVGERNVTETIEAKEIEIKPALKDSTEKWFSIDNENFEVRPIKITLLPKAIQMFCKKTAAKAFT